MTEADQGADGFEHGSRIVLLRFDGRGIRCGIHRQIEPGRVRFGEAEVFAGIPLHGRAGAGAGVSAFLGGHARLVAHADLVAVIEEGDAREREQESVGQFGLLRGQVRTDARRVVIAGDQGYIAFAEAGLVPGREIGQEAADVTLSVTAEEALFTIANERVIAVVPVVEVEIHMEPAVGDGCLRVRPFGNEGCFRILAVEHRADVAPDSAGAAALVVVALDEGTGHVHAEAVRAVAEPEAHDVLHRLAGGEGIGTVHGGLPGLRRVQPAVVQGGLALEKVEHVGAVARAFAADVRSARRALEPVVRPDVAAGILVRLLFAASAEPDVLFGGMAGHEVQEYPDALAVGLLKQVIQILVGAVARRDELVIAHVVARVLEWGIEAGIDPQRVAAQELDIGQLGGDTGEIADAIGVGIKEGLGIDFIEDRVPQPGGGNGGLTGLSAAHTDDSFQLLASILRDKAGKNKTEDSAVRVLKKFNN